MEKGSYFIFDEELWEEGGCFDCRIEQDALSILGKEKGKRGVYLCCCLDSKEKETVWHRMQIRYKKIGQGSIEVSYFATDDLELTIDTNKINLYSFAKEKLFITAKAVSTGVFLAGNSKISGRYTAFSSKRTIFLF